MEIREEYNEIRRCLCDFYDRYETHLLKMCENNQELVSNCGKRLAAFDNRREQIAKNTFSVVVIGEMKHGKSTLLNALLGKPAFPKAVQEATATISYLKHNDTAAKPEWRNHAVVTFWDEKREPVIVEHTELADFTTCLNKEKLDVAEEVKEVSIYTDSRFVEDGVTVVDTPGTNTTVQKHADITNEQIEKSNAAVFLFKAGTPGKKSDYEFLALAASKISRFFFVVNRVDEIGGIAKADVAINDIVKKMESFKELESLGTSRFFPTSGLLALLARYGYVDNEKYDEEEWQELDSEQFRKTLLQKSGVPEFEEALLAYLFKGERMSEFFHSHEKYISSCLKEDEKFLVDRKDALTGNINLKELENRRNILELERQKQQHTIELAASDLNEKLSKALQDFLEEAAQEIRNTEDRFETELKRYTDYQELEADWETVSTRPAKLYARVRNSLLQVLKKIIRDVFKSQDMKLRGQLNSSLQEAGVIALPDISGNFIPVSIQTAIDPGETAEKVKELKQKLLTVDKELDSLSDAEIEFERLKGEKNSLQEELNRTQAMAERRVEVLGSRPTVQLITVPGYDEEVDREGLGRVFQFIIGRKTVHRPPQQKIDTTAQDNFDKEMREIESWQRQKEEELNAKLAAMGDKYTEAQRANAIRVNKEKLRARTEIEKQEAESKLKEELEAARKKALGQNTSALCRCLSEALEQISADLQQTTEKCSEWAEKYIAGIRAESDEFLKTRGAELEALQKEISLKKKEREDALSRLADFEKEQISLRKQFEEISCKLNNIYK